MTSKEQGRSRKLAEFISTGPARDLPEAVRDAARQALLDYLGCSIAGHDDAAVLAMRGLARRWNAPGKARIFLGGTTTPAIAALVNGTMTHAMDMDDVHYMGGGHPSGPCWSTALALAEEHGFGDAAALDAFVTGYEVMTRLGGGGMSGVGRTLQHTGFHPTSVFGRAGAAAVAAQLYGLDADRVASALGVAATTAGGLVGSFGTHSKPFHAGKAAMDGILAADMAAEGFLAATSLYEIDRGILPSFLGGKDITVPELDFGASWYVLGNGYKRFASCRATHASAEAGMVAREKVAGRPIRKIVARVNPIAMVAAGNMDPKSGLEGRFSVAFCIALALSGYQLGAFDFTDEVLADPRVAAIIPVVECIAVKGQPEMAAYLTITFEDGEVLEAGVDMVSGHPDKPLGWDGLRGKYTALTEPVIGPQKTEQIFDLVYGFGKGSGSVAALSDLLRAPA